MGETTECKLMASAGTKNGNWKGGRSVASNGYILIHVGIEHHLSDVRGYAYEHRVVAEKKIGRRLRKGELIHHLDGSKTNNSPDNLLVVRNNFEHLSKHRKSPSNRKTFGQRNPLVNCKCGCGTFFRRFDEGGRYRQYVSGHNPPNLTIQTKVIEACGKSATISEILARTGHPLNALKVMLSKLVQQNKLTRKGRGIYGS